MGLDTYKPTHTTDQALVDYMMTSDQFTYADLEQNVTSTQTRRANLVSRLVRMKLIFEAGRDGNRKTWTWKKEAVSRTAAKLKRRSNDGRIWAAVRSLKEFSPIEVFEACAEDGSTVTLDYVQTYCRRMLKAGYTIVTQKARHGGRTARYKLTRDTGPLPPMVKMLECIIDGNTDKVTYVSGDRL